LLRRAIERGFTDFDFTIGDEPYKLDWADRQLVLYDHLSACTARGWLVVSASIFLREAKRVIKTTPVLGHLAVKVWAFARRLAWMPKAPAE
jgi:CelD/BcsL family acetyltransferase involved in cellulose biosynthesis